MILEELNRLIANAQTARDNVQSQWGKDYWDGVLAYLLRVANRLN
jgi:hypothetical protein